MGEKREIEFPAAPTSDLLAEFVAYWQAKRGERFAPPRSAIEPLELKRHLAHIFMLDVLDDGADYRYRLIGTDVSTARGSSVTGRKISELYADPPQALAQAKAIFGKVVAARQPVFARGPVFWVPGRDFLHFEGAYLPLSSDGHAVDIILCEVLYS